ncbi:unnamed protein product [Mytilus coruscus]|uniref:CCHC-type domain-containing protein n=1 Tax=Mytilus coruscus TaxID=42192 RepID=A0A6J8EEK7_MYTCO|nr:unnamed protein product [Mytilus coruscus]
MLRDRLVCGIKEDRIQRRLLAEPGLTFKKAMEVATAMEMAAKNAHDLQVQEPKQVHKVTIRNEECYRCGGSHNATDCKWKDAKCYVCDKKGHLAKNAEIKGSKMLKKNRNLSNKHSKGKCTLSSVRLKHILLKRIVTIWRIPIQCINWKVQKGNRI